MAKKKLMKKTQKKNIPKSTQSKSTKRENDDSDAESDDDNKDYEDFTNPLLLDKLEKKDLKHDKLKETGHDSDADVYDDSDDEDETFFDDDVDDGEETGFTENNSSEFITTKYRIPDKDRTTSNRLSIFEYTRLLEDRVSMLQHQASSMVNNENLSYAEEIARKEIYERKIPFKLIREVGFDRQNRILYEEWDPKEMILPVNLYPTS